MKFSYSAVLFLSSFLTANGAKVASKKLRGSSIGQDDDFQQQQRTLGGTPNDRELQPVVPTVDLEGFTHYFQGPETLFPTGQGTRYTRAYHFSGAFIPAGNAAAENYVYTIGDSFERTSTIYQFKITRDGKFRVETSFYY